LPAPPYRSYLYAPASRPDVCRKALAAGADVVILDLEDAVAPAQRPAARAAVAELVRSAQSASSAPSVACPVHVRINRAGDAYEAEDIAAAVHPGLDALRLPKATSPDQVRQAAELVTSAESAAGMAPGTVGLYPTIESAAGVLRAGDLAAASPRVRRPAFGAADFLADIGVPQSGDERDATLFARSQLVLASRAAGIGAPVDSVYTAVGDPDGLRAAAGFARSLGFFGKSIIHPSQLGPVHDAFTPDAAEVARARELLDAFEAAPDAALLVGADFVDPAVVARARAIVALAGALAQKRPRPHSQSAGLHPERQA
jgi:citrate lyase subunit beta/citryl-CoA lyase